MAREYEIARVSGCCRGCGRALEPNEEMVAAIFDEGQAFRREDFCMGCWQGRHETTRDAFSFWRSRVPTPQQAKKRVFVDDAVLIDFFDKLAGATESGKLNFRFVLALMLMRKRLLAYEGSSKDEAGQEVWNMRFKNQPQPVQVVFPSLDEQQIATVTAELSTIIET